jgi:predicted Zn-dependent protease
VEVVMRRLPLAVGLCVVAVACATSPTGRRQLKLFPDSQIDAMGATAFAKMVAEEPMSSDPAVNNYVQCVVRAVTRAPGIQVGGWEVRVFQKDTANAFALPGSKIGVYTGMLKAAQGQDQLATVIGHEVAHVLIGHSNERVSAEFLANQVQGALANGNPLLLAALGAGTQAGLLQYSRTHEAEADLLGQLLMAGAGFDPAAAPALWQNMAAAATTQVPELLSTHPAPATRVAELEARVEAARIVRDEAHAAGRRPACVAAQ